MQSQRNFHSFLLSVLIAAIGIVMALAPGHAGAATTTTIYVAPGGSDALACTANSSSKPFATIQKALSCTVDGDVVKLAPSGTTPYPGIGAISDNVVIEAQAQANARTVTIDAGKGLLSVSPGAALTLSAVSVTCVANDCAGTTATNEGTLTLIGDTVSGNQSTGSAIVNTTPANSSTPASLTVQSSTISGNAGMFGGGIRSVAGSGASGALTLSIVNSTFSQNFSLSQGGAVAIVQNTLGSSASIVNSTIAANTAQNGGGGLYSASPVSLSNTILAANTLRSGTQVDCQASGPLAQISDGPGGHNLIGNPTGCAQLVGGVNGDQVNVSRPGLLALANNGGPTETVALQSSSPALAAGDSSTCSAPPVAELDQRGDARHAGTACDIGAYDTAGAGGAVHATVYVAPGGSDALECTANSSSKPFATIQKALGCTVDGDVIKLAPSGATPYAGVGAISDNVVIEAQPPANARTVTIDAGRGLLSVSPGATPTVSGVSLTCVANDCAGPTANNEGALTLIADTLSGNESAHSAIVNTTPANSSTPASLTVQSSTISGNAGMFGAGIRSVAGSGASGALTLSIANSTVSGNFSQTQGGGVAIVQNTVGSSASIVNSTIAANTAQNGGGLYSASPVSLSNTILAANAVRSGTQTDCEANGTQAQIVDGPGGHNLIGSPSSCSQLVGGVNGDQVGSTSSPIDPRLAPLAYDGGATETQPPLAASPAIGAGNAATCELRPVSDVDQRGVSRAAPSRDVCDVGADDTAGTTPAATAPAITSPGSASATVASPLSFKLSATGAPTAAIGESGALPAGVLLTDNGDGTASLTGTPAAGSAGTYAITIVAKNGVGVSASQSFTLTVAALSVGTVTPSSVVAGAKSKSVTIVGAGFQPTTTLVASSAGIAFSSVKVTGSTKITAKETVAANAATGAYDLSVGVAGTSVTCSACLHVVAQPVAVASAPSTLGQGASNVVLTITGTDLANVNKASFVGPSAGIAGTVKAASATAVGIRVSVPAGTAPGSYTVTLATRDGLTASCMACLTVIAAPSIGSIAPEKLTRGQKATFTIAGSGFSADAALAGPSGVHFTNVVVAGDGTAITASVSVSASAPTGAALPITITNGPLGSYASVVFKALTIE
ncbi:MAG: choice-of-anchor Q domain-containing protein [Solirubrobacteraceae bacterium]